ncbi:MAG: alginate export family protein [Planctomycetota bacterium]
MRVSDGAEVFGKQLVLFSLFVFAGTSFAQQSETKETPSFIQQQRNVDESVRRQLDDELSKSTRGLFDWGGWLSSYVFEFDDGVDSSRTFRRFDLRLWGRAKLDEGTHEFYLRTRSGFVDFNTGDSYDFNDDDWEGPNLERGFYRFDLAKAFRHTDHAPTDYNLIATAGRDLVQFGNGLSLSAPLDHVSLRGTYRGFQLTGLAGKTVGSSPDFDLSRTAARSRRNVLGAQLKYTGLQRHEPFVYALWQSDHNEETAQKLFQGFDADTFHGGLGSTGELVQNLRYASEWVIETGHRYSRLEFHKQNNLRAWAFQNELEYLFPGLRKARASVEYLFGSGDSDRRFSPTNTLGGNPFDSRDTSFFAFGYQDTGLSFAPRYSNLHMWRAGASYHPFPEHRQLRNLELGTDGYLFYKHHSSAAVSDPTVDRQSGYLGAEVDYYANWNMWADFAWTARVGVFFPGDAFSDQTTRTFLLVGANWSF